MIFKVFDCTFRGYSKQEVLWQIKEWISAKKTHVIATLNVEMVMLAQKDTRFREVLNAVDLKTIDSARFGWAITELEEKNVLKKLLLWPFFLFPKAPFLKQLPVVTGVDIVEASLKLAETHHYRLGFLGSSERTIEILKQKIKKYYPHVQVSFAESGGIVHADGSLEKKLMIPSTDILFVAFGHGKQEKWMMAHKDRFRAKVMVGVGGGTGFCLWRD